MKYRKILSTLPFLLIILFFFLLNYRILIIKDIFCSNQYGECDNALGSSLKSAENKSFRESKRKLTDILKSDGLIEDYSLQFGFPDKIKVQVLVRKPKFAVKSLETNLLSLVEKDGQVIGVEEASNLPTLGLEGYAPNVGEQVSQEILFSLRILYDLFYLYQVRFATLRNDGVTVELPQGTSVIFPTEGDRQVLVGSLNLILARGNELPDISQVDLRFKDPVLR